ncbi:MAG: hypothetical protein NTW86_25220, partial [Candidatus Sumerlaeota bacterium]|nr:hypothetical protein [Candidatus Sumerlaeota bacterium]
MSGNNGTHPVIASSPRSRTDPSGIGVASSAARHPSLAPPPSGPKRTNKSWNIGTRNRLAPLRGIPLGLLAKHLIITGKPGSGKTTALMNIVIQLCQQGIPFILIEPVKKEYRLLKTLQAHANPAIRQLAQNLRIFTLGNESVSPGRLGLFGLLPGIREEEHIEHLLHAAAASMPLSSSLPFLLGESFEEVYETFRGRERFPAAGDLLAAAQRVCSRKGYSAATGSDIETALMTRLGSWTRRSLGKVLQSP